MKSIVFLSLFLYSSVISWNFETKTAVIFSLGSKARQNSDSYFGYSVALHDNSRGNYALVTATKANSAGFKSGALYKCKIDLSEECEEVNVLGIKERDEVYENISLGIALDVQSKGKKLVVTCAHLWKFSISDGYLVFGACYLLNKEMTSVSKIVPFRDVEQSPYTFKTALAQAGISASFSQDGKSLVFGAPGYKSWNGGVVEYSFVGSSFQNQSRFIFDFINEDNVNYAGYSVTSGNFFGPQRNIYAVGAPRDGSYRGKVYIIEEFSYRTRVIMDMIGDELGEYFGASVLGVDVNNDNMTDLLVGSPMFSFEKGRVYVYLSTGNNLVESLKLNDSSLENSRFGTSLAAIGDVNKDKFQDIAVGAPYYENEKGAIYIYHGSANGIKPAFAQKILAEDIDNSLMGFGISISKGKDVDSNHYPDILVGSYISGNAVLLRSHPVIEVHSKILFQPPQIHRVSSTCDLNNSKLPCFKTMYCVSYGGEFVPERLSFIVELRSFRKSSFRLLGRNYFLNGKTPTSQIRRNLTVQKSKPNCVDEPTYIQGDSDDFITPIQINARVDLRHDTSKQKSFCKDCPIINPTIPRHNSEVITFLTGCDRSDKCLSDLKVEANVYGGRNGVLTLGEDNELSLSIKVLNLKEPAFKAELHINLPENVELIKGEECRNSRESKRVTILICSIGNPFSKPSEEYKIKLDITRISPTLENFTVLVNSTTQSDEVNPEDNSVVITIPIRLSADIAIIGRTDQEQILLTEGESKDHVQRFIHIYNVVKYLYSPISSVNVMFFVPTNLSGTGLKFVNLETVGIHNEDHSGSAPGNCNFTNMDKGSDTMKTKTFTISEVKAKRSTDNKIKKSDLNRNPILDCKTSVCEIISCSVGPFDRSRKSATFYITGYVNVTALRSALKAWDNVTFISEGRVSINDKRANIQPKNHKPDEAKVITNIVRTISLKKATIAKWILPVSIACGVVLITIIIVALLKMGFFRRKQNEALQTLKADIKRQSCYEQSNISAEQLDTEQVN